MSKALIFVWYNCNESCFFCSAEVKDRKHINYSTLQILKIIHEKRKDNNEVEFIGWEVLIRKDAILLFQFCKKLGYKKISIETNGTKLADFSFFESILQAGVTNLVMSIHGSSPEINDMHTWLKKSFQMKQEALENASILSEKYEFEMFTNYVVTLKNIEDVPRFIGYIQKYTYLKNYIFAFCRPLPLYEETYGEYLVPFSLLKKVFDSLPLDKKIRIQYLPYCVLDPEKNEVFQEGFFKWKKQSTTRIDWDGKIRSLENAIQDHTLYFHECESCKYKNSCRWVWAEYADFFKMKAPPLLESIQ